MSLKDKTGIYSLGFDPNSFVGLILPFLFFVVVGGALAFYFLQ